MCQITAPLQLLASKNIRMQIGRIVYPCSPFFLSCRRHTKNQTAAHQQQRRRKPQSEAEQRNPKIHIFGFQGVNLEFQFQANHHTHTHTHTQLPSSRFSFSSVTFDIGSSTALSIDMNFLCKRLSDILCVGCLTDKRKEIMENLASTISHLKTLLIKNWPFIEENFFQA